MIQLAETIIAAAHQGEYSTGMRIECDQSYLGLRTLSYFGFYFLAHFDALRSELLDLIIHKLNARLDRLRRCLLQIRIERCVNAVRLIVEIMLAELIDQRV